MIRDHDHTVWLHGKPYWWTTEDQRLTLRPAHWLLTVPPDPPPAPVLADLVQWLAARPLPAPLRRFERGHDTPTGERDAHHIRARRAVLGGIE